MVKQLSDLRSSSRIRLTESLRTVPYFSNSTEDIMCIYPKTRRATKGERKSKTEKQIYASKPSSLSRTSDHLLRPVGKDIDTLLAMVDASKIPTVLFRDSDVHIGGCAL